MFTNQKFNDQMSSAYFERPQNTTTEIKGTTMNTVPPQPPTPKSK